MLDKLIHKTLKFPYKLNVALDTNNSTGKQQPIIFLHGIASNSNAWSNVLPFLNNDNFRLITIDLLGFGKSAKPLWSSYNIDEHAKSVSYTIARLGLNIKPILVGHSMGCLVAVKIASEQQDTFKSLYLLNMPIYKNKDLDESMLNYKNSGKKLSDFYFNLYQAITDNKEFALKGAKKIIERSNKDSGFILDEATWLPFKNSLNNTIKNQDSLNQIQQINIPITITYGRFDLLVINKYLKLLAKNKENVTLIPVNAGHEITPKYGLKIAKILSKKI